MNIVCRLECDHEITWGENPNTPGADLPHVGRIVYCPTCEADREIGDMEPGQVIVRTIQLSECAPSQSSTSGVVAYRAGDEAALFWNADGTWGYCFHGVGETGCAYESDDVTGFDSADAAEAAARTDYQDTREEAAEIAAITALASDEE